MSPKLILLNSYILMFYIMLFKVKIVVFDWITNVILLKWVWYVKNYVYICNSKNGMLQL